MLRSHGTAQLLGIALGTAGTLTALVASLGCSPMETDDYRSQSLSRTVTGTDGYHLTLTLSRAAVDETTSGLWVSVSANARDGSAATVSLVPDDEALDALIAAGGGSASLDAADVGAICPAEGDCVIGLTVLAEGAPSIDTSLYAHVRRPLDLGRFTADATLTIVED